MAEPSTPEISRSNEATAASNNWLSKAKNKVARLMGHTALTVGGEFWTALGSISIPLGILLSVLTGNPIPAILSTAPSAIGTTIGWQGVKHGSNAEKATYLGIKGATTGAAFLPGWGPLLAGLASAASTAIGMRHRK